MLLKLGHDINGNKVLKASFRDGTRGFSVQTLGNMPRTHRNGFVDFVEHVAESELHGYIKIYGTTRQKGLLGWH